MVSSSFTSTLTHTSNSPFCTKNHSKIPSPPRLSFSHRRFSSSPKSLFLQRKQSSDNGLSMIKVQNFDFSESLFDGSFGSVDDSTSPAWSGITAVEDKEEIPCPVGLRQYETMAVLRPGIAEEERLVLTQKYEGLVIGGGMCIEVFNRGVIPLGGGGRGWSLTLTWMASTSSLPTSQNPSPFQQLRKLGKPMMMLFDHPVSKSNTGNTDVA